MLLLDSCSRIRQQHFSQAIYLAFNYAGNLDDYQQDGLLQIIYSMNYNDRKVIYNNGATTITPVLVRCSNKVHTKHLIIIKSGVKQTSPIIRYIYMKLIPKYEKGNKTYQYRRFGGKLK